MTILEGQEAQNKRLQMAIRITSVGDGGLTYNNEYMMSFVAYASKLLKYYNVTERLRNNPRGTGGAEQALANGHPDHQCR